MQVLPPGVRRGRVIAGVGSALVGGLLTAFTLAMMNGALTPPKKTDGGAAVTFDAPPPKPPPPPPRPKPKPKPKKRSSAPPPVPMIGAGLSGLSFGLPGLDGALDGTTEELLGDVGDVVMTAEAVDDPPRPSRAVQPEYPVRARAKGVTGEVVLSVLIGADGRVQDVRVLESNPPGVFDEAALAAVRQWEYTPAVYEGRPVTIRARQPVVFSLE